MIHSSLRSIHIGIILFALLTIGMIVYYFYFQKKSSEFYRDDCTSCAKYYIENPAMLSPGYKNESGEVKISKEELAKIIPKSKLWKEQCSIKGYTCSIVENYEVESKIEPPSTDSNQNDSTFKIPPGMDLSSPINDTSTVPFIVASIDTTTSNPIAPPGLDQSFLQQDNILIQSLDSDNTYDSYIPLLDSLELSTNQPEIIEVPIEVPLEVPVEVPVEVIVKKEETCNIGGTKESYLCK